MRDERKLRMNIFDKAIAYVDLNRDELFSILSGLVRIDTQNFDAYGNEKEGQLYVAQWLEANGFKPQIYSPDSVPNIKNHKDYLAGRGLENRPNVSVQYEEGKSGGVMLAAHMDTVLVGNPESWKFDPFGGAIQSGRLYGRGAGDDKCGIAASLFVMKTLKDLGISLKKPLMFTSYVDEEDGGGDGALAACLKYPSETFVNLDGGSGEVWVAGIGGCVYEIQVSLDHPTDSASEVIDGLYILKQKIAEFGERRKIELHLNPLYSNSDMERSALKFCGIQVGNGNVGVDSGKISFVMLTDSSQSSVEKELADVLEETRSILSPIGILVHDFSRLSRFFNYAESKDNYGAIRDFIYALSEACGKRPSVRGACLSDLSVFLSAGAKSSFNYGIFRDFALEGGAHQKDEYIECEDLIIEVKALLLFILKHCL